jgi:DNA helicase-2/ATP-dependent DNA helicase PcrA
MEAVLASVGPLLVLAGAGTGKTRVVISRIFHLVRQGTPPERILAVTFTNKAAREMVLRIGRKFDTKRKPHRDEKKDTQPQKPEISTIHSLCVRILRRHAERGANPKRFLIVNRGQK